MSSWSLHGRRGRALLCGGSVCVVAALALTVLSRIAVGAQPSAPEYQLKALFLFNFTQFVEWPPGSWAAPEAPLLICVLGDDPFGSYLDDTIQGEVVRGHPLLAKRSRQMEDIDGCHVLFVSESESARFGRILTHINGRSVLSVADSPGFVHAGGMVRFVMIDNKIRLRINPRAVRAADLTISSKLLRPAELVEDD
jgi:hypothetical protein